jgi:TRAP-type C4-dicarboxylate transport system substrate-binding protein
MLVVALSLTAAATGAFAREFRAADTQSEDYPTVQALRYMGRVIAERGNGRHQIKVFHSHQLGEEKETLEQTRAGAIDLNRTNAALIGNMVPSMNVLAMPFLFRSIDHMQSEMIRSLGADPVELPYGQVLTGLATKLVDGAENNWPSFVTTDHCKYAGFYTLTEHTMSPDVLVMSEKAWETLSAEDRKIFREAARRSGQFMREKWRNLEDQSRKRAETGGVTIVADFDRKPFEQAMTGIYARTQRDRAAAQLIERIRKAE